MWMFWIFSRNGFAVIRILAYGPCIVWAANVVPVAVNLRQHSLPDEILYRKEIYGSLVISAVISVFLTFWMFATGIYILSTGSLKDKPRFLTTHCIVEWVLIALMILTLVWQANFLPNTLNKCHHANTWQLVEEDTSLFFVLGRNTKRTSVIMCKELMRIWILNICTLLLVGLSAIYPLLRLSVPWPLVRLYGTVRWHTQNLAKSSRNQQRAGIELREVHNTRPCRLTRKASLFDILNEDPEHRAILSLAANLHYSELVALSLTSKEMNSVVFPSKSVKFRSEKISLAACEIDKTKCWCCGIEICSTCQSEKNVPKPRSSTHITNCEPCCSTCYYKVICRRYVYGAPKPEMQYKGREVVDCDCRNMNTTNPVRRFVCRFCSLFSQDKALAVREEREMAELKHLLKQPIRCAICECRLNGGGLRWWGCSLCERECVSHFHPMWEKKVQ